MTAHTRDVRPTLSPETERSVLDLKADTDAARAVSRPRWPFAMAGAAVLALIIIRPWKPENAPIGSVQAQGSEHIRASSELEPVPTDPRGAIPARPELFRFRLAPNTRVYFVRLYDEQGRLLWTSDEIFGDTCLLPASVVLGPGRYSWDVLAEPNGSPDAKHRIPSPRADFEIAS